MTSANFFPLQFLEVILTFACKIGHFYRPLPPSAYVIYWTVSLGGGSGRGMVTLFRQGSFPSRKFLLCGRKSRTLIIALCIYAHNPLVAVARSAARPRADGLALPSHAQAPPIRCLADIIRSSHRIGLARSHPAEMNSRPKCPHFPTFRRVRAETQRAATWSARPPPPMGT